MSAYLTETSGNDQSVLMEEENTHKAFLHVLSLSAWQQVLLGIHITVTLEHFVVFCFHFFCNEVYFLENSNTVASNLQYMAINPHLFVKPHT